MGSPAVRVPHTPMSFPTRGTHATLPDTGTSPDDGVVSIVSRRETDDSLAHRAVSVVAGVPVEDHERLVHEVKCLHETLGKTQSMLDAMQARLQALERGLTRSEAQVDLLIRLQQSGASPSSPAQAPPCSQGMDPDTA